MTVRGRFLDPSGRPLSGSLVFRAPGTLTFPAADVILGGPVTVQLDAQGAIEVTLPATDAPDMDPTGWAYIVTEQLSGIPVGRSYNVLLPRVQPEVDLADIAPTDPAKPNYVGVPGPQGDRGPTGPPGSRIYSGATAPGAGLGVDGDLYVRYESTTFLGVTSTTVSTWQRSAGVWTQLGGEVRGAAWYLNNATTASTSTRPGDLLLRTDTGDIWQRTGSGWGTAVGNLKGPKGDKGDGGSAGATGPAGIVQSVNGKSSAAITLTAADVGALATAAAGAASGVATLGADGKVPAAQLPTSSGGGAVASVNGKTGAVVLAASDVGALPESGFVGSGNLILNTATVDYRGLSFTTAGVNRWVYQVDNTAEAGADAGSNFELANWSDTGAWKSAVLFGQRATGNVGIGTNSLIPGAKLSVAGAAALKNTTPPPADVGAAVAYSEGGLFKVVQADGTRVTLAPAEAAGTAVLLTGNQTVAGAKTFSSVPSSSVSPTTDNHLARKSYVDALGGGEWRASDFGLLTWAFDPACGHSAPLYPGAGPIRVTAVYLRSAASVTKVVWHFGGYAGGLATGSWAALYSSTGARVAQTADLSTAAAEPAEVHNTGGATVSVPLTAAYSAPAGLYYIAWRFQYNTSTGDGPMMLVAESSFSAPPNVFGLNNVRRFGSYATGAATAPASIALGSMENGSNRFWSALA